jgi:hypothetical protein
MTLMRTRRRTVHRQSVRVSRSLPRGAQAMKAEVRTVLDAWSGMAGSPAALASAHAALQDALAAFDKCGSDVVALETSLRTARLLMNEAEQALRSAFLAYANGAEILSGGNFTQITALGLQAVPTTGSSPGIPEAPTSVAYKNSATPTTVEFSWPPVPGAQAYNAEVTFTEFPAIPDEKSVWERAGTTFRAGITLQNMPVDRTVWLRVMSANTNGSSPWSTHLGQRPALTGPRV